jgi:hypothetical protein
MIPPICGYSLRIFPINLFLKDGSFKKNDVISRPLEQDAQTHFFSRRLEASASKGAGADTPKSPLGALRLLNVATKLDAKGTSISINPMYLSTRLPPLLGRIDAPESKHLPEPLPEPGPPPRGGPVLSPLGMLITPFTQHWFEDRGDGDRSLVGRRWSAPVEAMPIPGRPIDGPHPSDFHHCQRRGPRPPPNTLPRPPPPRPAPETGL